MTLSMFKLQGVIARPKFETFSKSGIITSGKKAPSQAFFFLLLILFCVFLLLLENLKIMQKNTANMAGGKNPIAAGAWRGSLQLRFCGFPHQPKTINSICKLMLPMIPLHSTEAGICWASQELLSFVCLHFMCLHFWIFFVLTTFHTSISAEGLHLWKNLLKTLL